ncbi:MAG: DUF1194 domain-containing protein [Mangrovicoccus sp.]
MRLIAIFLAVFGAWAGWASWAEAQDQNPVVDLELVLLADASGSIDWPEIQFQRQGYATAITSPEVLKAIRSTAYGKIAVSYVEWASAGSENIVVPWMVIEDSTSANAFAQALLPPPRLAFGRNAIGSALLFGQRMIEENNIESWRQVIDFSGDSANNWNGPSVEMARREVLEAGTVINGLAILCRACNGRPSGADLEQRYRDEIIGGPGAFVITAETAENFADAVKRKLILEISGKMPGADLAHLK